MKFKRKKIKKSINKKPITFENKACNPQIIEKLIIQTKNWKPNI